MKRFNDQSSQKDKNMKYLYKIIRQYGPVTKGTLLELTGLKQTTCARIIDELLRESIIIESGVDISSGGRKPVMYEVNSSVNYSIGIDISRTFTKVLLLDINLSIKDEAFLKMDHTCTPEKTIQFIRNAIVHMLAKHHINLSQLLGIGVGVIEPFDMEKGIILNSINFHAEGWSNVNIVDDLKETFDTKVLINSGVNTAILAEHEIGLKSLIGDLVYIIAGVGIRMGVMTNHHLFQGPAVKYEKFGNGHMAVNTSGKKCICGNYGCIHTYSTILVLIDEVIDHIKRGHPSLLMKRVNTPEDIQFDDICWAIEHNDPLCSFIVRDFAYHTGVGIGNIISVFQPSIIILSGPMFNRLDLFYETVQETAKERINRIYPGYDVKFSRGKLGINAAAIGAGSMVIDDYLN